MFPKLRNNSAHQMYVQKRVLMRLSKYRKQHGGNYFREMKIACETVLFWVQYIAR